MGKANVSDRRLHIAADEPLGSTEAPNSKASLLKESRQFLQVF